MEAERCQTLLVEASMLITSTRSCIARSMRLLAQLEPDGARRSPSDHCELPRAARTSSSHPPSAPPP